MSVNSVNNYPQQVQNFPNDRDFALVADNYSRN